MTVTVGQARSLATRLLRHAGLSQDKAEATARAVVLADVWGLGSHGLLRLPIYLDRTTAGGYPAAAELTVVADTGPLLSYDGGGGLGHWQLTHASRDAVSRAATYGISAVAVGNSGHCGALGVFAHDIAAAGCLGVVLSCGPAVLPPWGGDQRLLSTSPIAAGIPVPGSHAVVDLALSTVARGKIAAHAKAGTPLPDGWALDASGQPTNDPVAALSGLLAPLGGAKGFALAFMVEAMTAGLVGPRLSADVPDFFDAKRSADPQQISHLVLAIDPARTDAAGDPEAARTRFGELAERVAAAGGRVPGSRRKPPADTSDDDLIDVDPQLWSELRQRGEQAGAH